MLRDDELLVTNNGNGGGGLSDLEVSEESSPSDAESISDQTNIFVANGKKIKTSFRSTFNLPGAVKNMLQVHYKSTYRVSQVKLDETKRLFQTENTPWGSET